MHTYISVIRDQLSLNSADSRAIFHSLTSSEWYYLSSVIYSIITYAQYVSSTGSQKVKKTNNTAEIQLAKHLYLGCTWDTGAAGMWRLRSESSGKSASKGISALALREGKRKAGGGIRGGGRNGRKVWGRINHIKGCRLELSLPDKTKRKSLVTLLKTAEVKR